MKENVEIYINRQITKNIASIIGHETGVGIYNHYDSQLFRLSDTSFCLHGDRILGVFLN